MNRHLLAWLLRIVPVLALAMSWVEPALGGFTEPVAVGARTNALAEPGSAVLAGLGLALMACFTPRSSRPKPRRARGSSQAWSQGRQWAVRRADVHSVAAAGGASWIER